MTKTEIINHTEKMTHHNVFATTDQNRFLDYYNVADKRKWKPSHIDSKSGTLYILTRTNPMKTPDTDTTFMNDGNDLLKAIIKWMLIAVAVCGSLAIIITS